MRRDEQIKALEGLGREPALARRTAWLQRGRRRASARLDPARVLHWPNAARKKLWQLVHGKGEEGLRELHGRADRAVRRLQQAKAGIEGDLPFRLAGSRPMATPPRPCTRTSRCTPTTRCRRWSAASTTRSSAPTRSSGHAGSAPVTRATSTTFLPIVADAEAGFGGVLNAFELMKNMIAAGAAGVHFEDQLAAVRSAVTWAAGAGADQEAVEKLIAARLCIGRDGACRRWCSRAPIPRPPTC